MAHRMATMAQTARPLSPHLGIYRWQIQMVVSILHRVTGVYLAFGAFALGYMLLALSSGPDAYAKMATCAASLLGQLLVFGWVWSLSLHLLNGLRHLVEDFGLALSISRFVASGWIVVSGSFLLTALIYVIVFLRGGAA